jgi:hypothetical protein
MRWLKSLFGDEAAVAKAAAEAPVVAIAGVELPLGLRLGGAVALDSALFDVAGGAFGFAAPRGHQLVEAYGQIDLGAGALLHRFYLTDDAFVQVNTTSGVVEEIKYFVFHDTRQPATQAAFRDWVQPGSELGAPEVVVNGRAYSRVWGEPSERGWIPPVVFEERVYRGRPPVLDDELTHYAMVYQRDIQGLDRSETLLISAEDYGPAEFCVVYSLGIDVTSADLEIT